MPDVMANPATQGAGSTPAPQTTPAAAPQSAKGDIEQAKANVHIAMSMLETSIVALGSTSPEGQAVMKALTGLSKSFAGKNQKAEDLVPAEVVNLVQGLPDTYKQGLQQQKPGMGMPGA